MPIVDPGGLDALGLVGFQINAHYVSASLPGHHGETRDERLREFARVNPAVPVIGLPEGDWLRAAPGGLVRRRQAAGAARSGANLRFRIGLLCGNAAASRVIQCRV